MGKLKYIDIWWSCSINKLKIKEKCRERERESCDEFARGFYSSIVDTGVNKCLSNAAILKNYQTALDGMNIYHDFIVTSQAPETDKTLAPSFEINLDRNNISVLEKAILNEYKTSKDSILK